MLEYRVKFTGRFSSDLDRIKEYVAEHSPGREEMVVDRILRAVDSLEWLPRRYRQVAESKKRGMPIHRVLAEPYLVYYRVEEAARRVVVLTVRHGRQEQPREFK